MRNHWLQSLGETIPRVHFLKGMFSLELLPGKDKLKRFSILAYTAGIFIMLCSCNHETPPVTPTPSAPAVGLTPSATFVFPTSLPTGTRTPEPIQSSTPSPFQRLGPLLLDDDFSQDRGWELGQQSVGAISLQSDRLVIAIRQSQSFLYSLFTPSMFNDFYLEIELRADLCQTGDEFGLMFRVNQNFEHYRYAITCEGNARAVRILSGESRSLVPMTDPPSLISGPKSTNRLGLLVSGGTFQFWLNDSEVFTARDVAISEGAIGLFARSGRGNQVTVSFDNLRIHSLAPAHSPTSTPAP